MVDISTASKEDTTDGNRASGEATNGENTGDPDQAKGDTGQQKGKRHCFQQQGSHRLEKYLNTQDCLEKFLKIKFATQRPCKVLEFYHLQEDSTSFLRPRSV